MRNTARVEVISLKKAMSVFLWVLSVIAIFSFAFYLFGHDSRFLIFCISWGIFVIFFRR